MDEWNVDEAVQILKTQAVYDGYSLTVDDQQATNEVLKRILRESAPLAALAVAHLAVHSSSERMRFNAATWILDRNLGKITENPSTAEKDPFALLLEECVIAMKGNEGARTD
jgi:hypothetical protein